MVNPFLTPGNRTQPYSVGPTTGLISDHVNFLANSVIVDNPGGQWVNVFDGNVFRTIAPWTLNAVINLQYPLDTATYSSTPPAGQLNSGTGNPATLTYDEEVLAPSAGVNMAQTLSQAVASSVATAGAVGPASASASFGFNVAVPAGTWSFLGFAFAVSTLTTSTNTFVRNYVLTITRSDNNAILFEGSRSISLPAVAGSAQNAPPGGIEFNLPKPISIPGGINLVFTIVTPLDSMPINGANLSATAYLAPTTV